MNDEWFVSIPLLITVSKKGVTITPGYRPIGEVAIPETIDGRARLSLQAFRRNSSFLSDDDERRAGRQLWRLNTVNSSRPGTGKKGRALLIQRIRDLWSTGDTATIHWVFL